jgi:hypothetical protein
VEKKLKLRDTVFVISDIVDAESSEYLGSMQCREGTGSPPPKSANVELRLTDRSGPCCKCQSLDGINRSSRFES